MAWDGLDFKNLIRGHPEEWNQIPKFLILMYWKSETMCNYEELLSVCCSSTENPWGSVQSLGWGLAHVNFIVCGSTGRASFHTSLKTLLSRGCFLQRNFVLQGKFQMTGHKFRRLWSQKACWTALTKNTKRGWFLNISTRGFKKRGLCRKTDQFTCYSTNICSGFLNHTLLHIH